LVRITGEAPANAMQIEVTASQFKWEFRYPGKDKVLGKKYFKAINESENNPLGQLWEDSANKDDIYIAPVIQCTWLLISRETNY
jgi:cytochrome c oxidase subunit 2